MPPASKYDEEGAALRALSRQEDSKYIAADRSADRAKRMTASSHRTRRDRYNHYVILLAQEFKEQTISREFTIKRLAREKHNWFAHCECSWRLARNLKLTLCSDQGEHARQFHDRALHPTALLVVTYGC